MHLHLHPMKTQSFAERLRAKRAESGLTQAQLARKSGVTRGAISQWETGDVQRVDATPLLRWARALGTTLEYLLEGETPPNSCNEHASDYATGAAPRELGAWWRALTPTQREAVTNQVRALALHNAELLEQLGTPPADPPDPS